MKKAILLFVLLLVVAVALGDMDSSDPTRSVTTTVASSTNGNDMPTDCAIPEGGSNYPKSCYDKITFNDPQKPLPKDWDWKKVDWKDQNLQSKLSSVPWKEVFDYKREGNDKASREKIFAELKKSPEAMAALTNSIRSATGITDQSVKMELKDASQLSSDKDGKWYNGNVEMPRDIPAGSTVTALKEGGFTVSHKSNGKEQSVTLDNNLYKAKSGSTQWAESFPVSFKESNDKEMILKIGDSKDTTLAVSGTATITSKPDNSVSAEVIGSAEYTQNGKKWVYSPPTEGNSDKTTWNFNNKALVSVQSDGKGTLTINPDKADQVTVSAAAGKPGFTASFGGQIPTQVNDKNIWVSDDLKYIKANGEVKVTHGIENAPGKFFGTSWPNANPDYVSWEGVSKGVTFNLDDRLDQRKISIVDTVNTQQNRVMGVLTLGENKMYPTNAEQWMKREGGSAISKNTIISTQGYDINGKQFKDAYVMNADGSVFAGGGRQLIAPSANPPSATPAASSGSGATKEGPKIAPPATATPAGDGTPPKEGARTPTGKETGKQITPASKKPLKKIPTQEGEENPSPGAGQEATEPRKSTAGGGQVSTFGEDGEEDTQDSSNKKITSDTNEVVTGQAEKPSRGIYDDPRFQRAYERLQKSKDLYGTETQTREQAIKAMEQTLIKTSNQATRALNDPEDPFTEEQYDKEMKYLREEYFGLRNKKLPEPTVEALREEPPVASTQRARQSTSGQSPGTSTKPAEVEQAQEEAGKEATASGQAQALTEGEAAKQRGEKVTTFRPSSGGAEASKEDIAKLEEGESSETTDAEPDKTEAGKSVSKSGTESTEPTAKPPAGSKSVSAVESAVDPAKQRVETAGANSEAMHAEGVVPAVPERTLEIPGKTTLKYKGNARADNPTDDQRLGARIDADPQAVALRNAIVGFSGDNDPLIELDKARKSYSTSNVDVSYSSWSPLSGVTKTVSYKQPVNVKLEDHGENGYIAVIGNHRYPVADRLLVSDIISTFNRKMGK